MLEGFKKNNSKHNIWDDLIGKEFKHNVKGGKYKVLNYTNIQIDNVWKKAILYENIEGETFVREYEEFLNKFKII